jgi:hypothetical protein
MSLQRHAEKLAQYTVQAMSRAASIASQPTSKYGRSKYARSEFAVTTLKITEYLQEKEAEPDV